LIYIAADTLEEAVVKMNEDHLPFGCKTKYMVISFRKNIQKSWFKSKLVKNNLSVESIKYLDEKLKFAKNILAIQKKVAKKSILFTGWDES
jgi:hypothetical protein